MKVHAPHIISTLQEQVRRFQNMSVQLAKGGELASSQANDIAHWASKLINALETVREGTQRSAAECRNRVQAQICETTTEANKKKRKILETQELDSVRTLKANFRLIFGPNRETTYSAQATRYQKASNLQRIAAIRGLCANHPHGVIALSLAQPSKGWTESTREIFEGLIKWARAETTQDWPEEIVDVMDQLEKERPMCDEFRMLRETLRRKDRIIDYPGQQSPDEPLSPSAVHRTDRIDHSARMQARHPRPSSDVSQTQNAVSDTNASFEEHEQEKPPSEERRAMGQMFANTAASSISRLPEPFRSAALNSRLRKYEVRQGQPTTGCLAAVFPKDYTQDVSFTIWCGHNEGYHLIDVFGMELAMTS